MTKYEYKRKLLLQLLFNNKGFKFMAISLNLIYMRNTQQIFNTCVLHQSYYYQNEVYFEIYFHYVFQT